MKRNPFRLGSRRRMIAAYMAVIVLIGAVSAVFINVRPANAAWWNGSWYYRKKITFNNSASGENLQNFSVRVSLSSSNINYSHTQDQGQDIRFVDSDDTTTLNYEIEKWDESGTSEVWVKVPQIDQASTTDFIWIYYGNASASDGQNKTAVWDSNFAGIWHSGETSGTTLADSTGNANNGTKFSSTNPNPGTGQIAGAQVYSNSSSRATVSDANSLDMTASMTISTWFRATSLGSWAAIACKDATAAPNYCFQIDDTSHINFNYTNTFIGGSSSSTVSTNTWYYASVTFDTSQSPKQIKFYINGALDNTATQTTALPANNGTLVIGNDSANEFFPGTLDEVRLSNSVRSADWIEAEYVSQTNAMNSFGTEEQYPPDPPTLTALGGSVALQPTFQLRATDRAEPNYLRYKIQVCSNSDCSTVLRTIDQTASQTGWSGQDTQSGTAYVASTTIGGSTLASHTYQTPALSLGTQYWWRAYAIDPGGSNTWSEASEISTFITTGPPAAPTLLEPSSSAIMPLAPMFRLYTTDPNSDSVRYKIEICSTNNCSSIVRTIDQTASQTGWASQDTNGATSYSAGTVLANSQPAVHVYQSPVLAGGTQYWWRAYAIDPGGYNQWSSASGIETFTAQPSNVKINGGTTIKGGTEIGQ